MLELRFLLKPEYSNSRALIIGINDYKNEAPLSYAVNDAIGLKEQLINSHGFPEDHVSILLNEAATASNIRKELAKLTLDQISVDDRIVIFYAGHGATKTGLRGEIGYLVPHDADHLDPSTLIRWSEFTTLSDAIRAKHILFIMDACYGGLAITRSMGPGGMRFISDMLCRYSRQVITAGKADEVVSDSGGPLPNHSVFTAHLLEGMRGKAATEQGIITANGLMAYVYRMVSQDKNSHQTPHYGHVEGDGDFVLTLPPPPKKSEESPGDTDSLVIVQASAQPADADDQDPIAYLKKILPDPTAAIRISDFLQTRARAHLGKTGEEKFPLTTQVTQSELLSRIAKYEEIALETAVAFGCVGCWGNRQGLQALQKALSRSTDNTHNHNGMVAWIALRWFPMILYAYIAGIAAIDAKRYDSLAAILCARTSDPNGASTSYTLAESIADAILELNNRGLFKMLPGHDRYHTPMNEYLHKTIQSRLDDVFFVGRNYEEAFDEFEVLLSLIVLDLKKQKGIQHSWTPVGRYGWKGRHGSSSPFKQLTDLARRLKEKWPPLQDGLFGGSFERFETAAIDQEKALSHLSWY